MDFELLKSIGSKIMDVAPSLAGAILSPNPVTVMSAFSAIKRAVGLSDSAKEVDVVDALQGMTPEQRLPLVKAEYDFKVSMRQSDLDEIKLFLGDTQNARGRDTDLKKSGHKNVRADVLLALAFLTVLGAYGVIAFFGTDRLGMIVVGSILTTIGTFVQKIGTVFDFEFGSSRGSVQKTEDARQAAETLAKVVTK